MLNMLLIIMTFDGAGHQQLNLFPGLSCHSQNTLMSWQTASIAPMVSSSRWRMVQFLLTNRAIALFGSCIIDQHIAEAADGADPRFTHLIA